MRHLFSIPRRLRRAEVVANGDTVSHVKLALTKQGELAGADEADTMRQETTRDGRGDWHTVTSFWVLEPKPIVPRAGHYPPTRNADPEGPAL